MLRFATWQVMAPAINDVIRKRLGLRALPWYGPYFDDAANNRILYGFSAHVVPKPKSWSEGEVVTGYWHHDEADTWTPPQDLERFLADGPRPIYIGFGSMLSHDAETFTRTVMRALALSGQRAVVARGWGGLAPPPELDDRVMVIDHAPHDWLFPRVALAVHHGGAGTTAAALRAGIPSVVVPFFGDQPFWGWRLNQLGVAPPALPRGRLTAEALSAAIAAAGGDTMRQRAEALGRQLRAEDGVGRAIETLNRWGLLSDRWPGSQKGDIQKGGRPLPPRRLVDAAGTAALVLTLSLPGIALPPSSAAAQAAEAPAEPAVPVVVAPVRAEDVPLYLGGIGSVQAYNTVAIRSRIDGQLMELRFREGQEVAKGAVLAILDRRPLEANLKQAVATLAKDQSQLQNAQADLVRYQGMKEYASRKTLDTQQAEVAQYQAQVTADEAQVDYARAQLDYATITSPIAGRTGIRQIDAGNIVHAGDAAPIVTITQLHPISVIFTVNADDLPAFNLGAAGPATALPVQAYAKDNKTLLADGKLELVDNQIDQSTGTVKLKASFPNEDNRLWPGQFVNAHVRVSVRRGGLTVPVTAIQQGPAGAYVWVVSAEGRAAMAPVTVARTDEGRVLIDKGLSAGQMVVTDGQYNLKPGTRVAPQPPRSADGRAGAGAGPA
ncbi:efflux RND transporter periplasmic adaptor subunit [Nitrospirillum sp. BR 11828]|uniref:efflux RND transporter periplasmic adaptor subunit n=1 Tax=Nitrospirillum sp. BR 11828 TaxID=3104325 RepID=UPI002ACA5A11|nr:efflux RND transporter periplasmic adaptor subunit [Nitrospirillum sp. BR 11828]MDZ5649878.1 efflux RND transporter periplasmic adaptor subunit [Nitrospirillum sp. BR 11828]